jgi:pyruvate dehydrogenase E2 component (dihydrolipoamide acetyltransferase)/2-oxoisovalerate dehydrogenase E2 component (dihydrolipoyl transacylase)
MDFVLPTVGEGLVEVELVRWLVQPGESVTPGQPLMEVMSDKATMEVPAAFHGTINETLREAGTKIKVGELVMRYHAGSAAAPPEKETQPEAESKKPIIRGQLAGVTAGSQATATIRPRTGVQPLPGTGTPRTIAAAPSVRHLARKLGIDLTTVSGTGPAGRILLDDLAPHISGSRAKSDGETRKEPERPTLDLGKAGTRTKIVGLRRKIAERMVASKRQIPHYAYVDECDLTDLVRVRAQLKAPFYEQGIKLTYLPFIVKAVARALKAVPAVNATYDDATEELTLHESINIGIAVAAPTGLIVPVIQHADRLEIAGIAREIDRLSTAARTGKIQVSDLKGGTFTVTSIGNIGGLISTPIINAPEVGIIGIGKIVRRPVYDDHDQLRPADMLYLSFSFDHRVLDGAIGAMFGNAVIKQLHAPAGLLLPETFG